MMKDTIKTIYCELLGRAIKSQLDELGIPQNEVSSYFDDNVELISPAAISQIIRGKRNITCNTADALQETLDLHNPKNLFFPNLSFCETLVVQLIHLLSTDEFFNGKHVQKLLQENEDKIDKNITTIANSLYNFFPDFPEEESSYQISESIEFWVIELVALISQL